MVVDGGGHFNSAGIDGVHTCLYYYRSIQHMTVLRVIQYNTTTTLKELIITTLNVGTVT